MSETLSKHCLNFPSKTSKKGLFFLDIKKEIQRLSYLYSSDCQLF